MTSARCLIAIMVMAGGTLALPLFAQERDERRDGEARKPRPAAPEGQSPREMETLERKLNELRAQERRLAEGGAGEEDRREVRQKREAVEREMRQIRERAASDRPPREQAERGRVEHLRAAAEHLRAAGMPDMAEQVMRNAERAARPGGDARPLEPGAGERPAPAARREDRPDARGDGGVPRQIEELRREVARLREELNELRQHVRERAR